MTQRRPQSLPAAYFEDLYAQAPDPWNFTTSAYERAKYDATLAALGEARFARALEVGCSVGVLTHDLAPRCDGLLALDAAEAPLEAARARCAGLAQLRFRRAVLPDEWPHDAAPFDLILLSEVLYYFDAGDLDRLAACAARDLMPGGTVLLVHWTGPTDYPLAGDAAAERFIAAMAPCAAVTRQSRTPHYRLDLLRGLPVRGEAAAG